MLSPDTPARRAGFTLTEVMVVVGLIVVILAILLPTLSAVRTQSLMANSMSNMRQVAAFMQLYSSDNRETIVPSQFDYSSASFKGRVRSEIPTDDEGGVLLGNLHEGTWADILWTVNELGPVDPVVLAEVGHDYRYSVPDVLLYRVDNSFKANPFRSAAMNRRNVPDGTGALPYGNGAQEMGHPGFFAANDFFDARSDAPAYDGQGPPTGGRWWSTGQIRSPGRSMYLVDSFAGMVIEPIEEPYLNIGEDRTIEVDFRYSGNALMLFLDGHIDPVNPWDDLEHLQDGRNIRVTNLDKR